MEIREVMTVKQNELRLNAQIFSRILRVGLSLCLAFPNAVILAAVVAVALAFPSSPARAAVSDGAPPPTPVLADGFRWRQITRPLESALGSQRRMLQVATVGVCLALWIMMRK